VANGNRFAQIISAFGAAAKEKLSNPVVTGAPEDQLRSPLEALVKALAEHLGIPPDRVSLVGEHSLADLATRPDFAVTVHGPHTGHIELKAPGTGADPRRFRDDHNKRQWNKLKSLPNLIYTDGNSFSLWQNGELKSEIVTLEGDIGTSGARLRAPPALELLFADFLRWQPVAPRTPKQLAETSARLCRLLREEVAEELDRHNPGLTSLAQEWRTLLFPEATNEQFADGYAQAVTFGLLVARARNVSFDHGLDAAANELRQTSSLIGTALRLLIDNPEVKSALKSALDTLARVLNVVDWQTVTRGSPEAWLYFYEDFLAVYDNNLRKETGSYYTPPEVVAAMVRLTDEALKSPDLFDRAQGLADRHVTICDPAVGTGTFLLGVLRSIARHIEADEGTGAVGPALQGALGRIFGFEKQFGPFAVAQLRIMAELQALSGGTADTGVAPNLYVTDTLGNPFEAEQKFSGMVAPIGESRKKANRIKRETPITVVIGNPPYKEKARGRGGWIEGTSETGHEKPMARWTPPRDWRVGAHTKHLKNLYVYFWRWATLKVFGSGWHVATGQPETDRSGIVCFITVAGFLNGPGFQKMREELRRDCSAIWVIDCSPEGHQPEVATRIFQGVQQPICIVLAARSPNKDQNSPAALRFTTLPAGHRERDKFPALADLSLRNRDWLDGPAGWREPFLPEQEGAWATFPALVDVFDYDGSGVMPGRTWIIAPDHSSLAMRWKKLIDETDPVAKEILFHPHLRNGLPGDKHTNKSVDRQLPAFVNRTFPISNDAEPSAPVARYGFRTLDRQWIIPDARLINQPNPSLWFSHSSRQSYLTAPEDRTPESGPAATMSGCIPDLHHYHGRGGRVYPLWRDAAATQSNIKPALLAHLSTLLGRVVSPEDMMAYIAAVMAHPAFTARFQKELKRPGLRLPITADATLFAKAVALGREVVWLHTYGERFANPAEGRPASAPRLPKAVAPRVGKTIAGDDGGLPDTMTYDAASKRLHIGQGTVDNVTQGMVDYEVSGMNVLRQWFSYRKRDRSRPIIGDRRKPSPLSDIQPDHWLAEYTSDLIDLLNVLGRVVALEPRQAQLLDAILAGRLVDRAHLVAAGALGEPATAAEDD
jgi:hypothetical protein